jgi:hypothetical protein
MSHKEETGRNAAIHHGDGDNKSGANDPKAAVHKPKVNPDDQARHGGGEGTSGIQPGDGHPRGR